MSFTDYAIDALLNDDTAALLAAELLDTGRINDLEAAFLIATLEPVIRAQNAPIAERLSDLEQRATALEHRCDRLEQLHTEGDHRDL